MVERYVFLKLKEAYATPQGRREMRARALKDLSSLPGVVQLRVGLPREDAWDMSIVLVFEKLDDVKTCVSGPRYQQFVAETLNERAEVKEAWNFGVEVREPKVESGERPRRSWQAVALRSAVVVLLLMGCTMGALYAFGYFGSKLSFRPQTEALLQQISDGKHLEVYASASPRMREFVLEEKFVETASTMRESLGSFVRIRDVVKSQVNRGRRGKTGMVVMEIEFENATTTGSFSYQKVLGTWRLMGMNVEIPKDLRERVDQLNSQRERIEAPRRVVDRVRGIVLAVKEAQLSAIYEDAADQFKQAVSPEGFEAFIASRKKAMGELITMLDIIESAQSPNKKRARVYAVLQFEKAKTTGEFNFINDGGKWQLASFKIRMPPQFVEERWRNGDRDAGR